MAERNTTKEAGKKSAVKYKRKAGRHSVKLLLGPDAVCDEIKKRFNKIEEYEELTIKLFSIKCPGCGSLVDSESEVHCPVCGVDIEDEEAAKELAKKVKIAIVKVGEKGSFICSDGEITKIDIVPAQAIDTTGAGDSYAAGFLYGYCNEWSLEDSGKLGSLLAAKVVEQKGVGMKDLDGDKLKGEIK